LYLEFTVKLIPINRMTDAQWLAYYQLRLELRAYVQTDPPPPQYGPEAYKKRTLNIVRELNGQEYVLFQGKEERPVGWIRFSTSSDDLNVSFDYHHRVIPAGFVHLIAKGIDHRLRTYHYPRLSCVMTQERHKAAMQSLLPSQALTFIELELLPANIRHDKAAQYLAAFAETHPGYYFELHSNLPNEVRADYLRLYATLQRDLPLANERLESNTWTPEGLERLLAVNATSNQEFHLIFLCNPSGERIGLTELTVHTVNGKCAQGMTGVLAPYRGRGLAQALKAEMLRHLPVLSPNLSVINTSTSEHNHPMRHINLSLGYAQKGESSHFIFLPAAIEHYMQANRNHPGPGQG
jgi:RimJ/RimL family protein N-acetyltransferase